MAYALILAAALLSAGGICRAEGKPQGLSSDGELSLRNLLKDGYLDELNQPDFGRYRAEAERFYQAHGYALAWVRKSRATPSARQVIKFLERAEQKGLRAEDYDGPRWAARLARLKGWNARPLELDLIRFDLALTVCALRYISDRHIGRVNPRLFHSGLDIPNAPQDLSQFLQERVENGRDIGAELDLLDPPFPAYRRTEQALQTYLKLAAQDDGELLPIPPSVVRPGDSYTGIARLTRLLRLLGDIPPGTEAAEGGATYEDALAEGVRHFQVRNGLDPEGNLDERTLRELNTPLQVRATQLRLTLERWRWLPHEFSRPPIVVNIPEFRLHSVDTEYRQSLSMKVVVGRA
ncbi:MAG TPA: hypothetical protein VNI01_03485, partial [Elusimicrobiota bacterium]|nr:hypothetical protein [Elusimicrobiota bacterium]